MISRFRSSPVVYAAMTSLALQAIVPATLMADDSPRALNVRFAVAQKKVVISYDLKGEDDKKYRVTVFLKKESNPAFAYQPKNAEGDLGEGISPGTGREIVWDLYKEFPNGMDGGDFYFSVIVEEPSSGTLMWAGVAAVGAGVMALLIFGSSKTDHANHASLPLPPGRP